MWFFPSNLNLATISVLIGSSCYKQIPQSEWLKQHKFFFSLFWRPYVQDQGTSVLWFFFFFFFFRAMVLRALFLACSILTWEKERQRETSAFSTVSLLILTLILWNNQGPGFMTSFKLNYLLTPNIATVGIRTLKYESGGTHIFSSWHFMSGSSKPMSSHVKIFVLSW